MNQNKLIEFFEIEGFNVHPIEQNGKQCAEIEKWTEGGVDMIIWLMPFTLEEFEIYVDDFDVDDEIDLHRQDQQYKDNFKITRSVADFTEFHNGLKETLIKLKNYAELEMETVPK